MSMKQREASMLKIADLSGGGSDENLLESGAALHCRRDETRTPREIAGELQVDPQELKRTLKSMARLGLLCYCV